MVGAVLGGLLLGAFPDLVLVPLLAVIPLVSAVKLARHGWPDTPSVGAPRHEAHCFRGGAPAPAGALDAWN
ncbi:hypothetical protein ACFXGI_27455 [Streptomyces sp. NPDC059355]|uniref:hypothetical protein n=1 Tax=Streptomyces sp. NPDC059355 TaxID=3346811 RepID=UPI003695F1F2